MKIFKRHFRKQKYPLLVAFVLSQLQLPTKVVFAFVKLNCLCVRFWLFFAFFFLFFFGFKKKILKVIDDDKLFFINYSHSSFDFFVCWIARETENNILKKTAHTIKREREKEQVKFYAIRNVRQGGDRKGHLEILHAIMAQVFAISR
jgi:hypothetical protein